MDLKSRVQLVKRRLAGKSLQDFVLTLGSNGIIAFMGAVAGILAARLLGPEGRGELAAAIVWAGILGIVSQVGMPQAITYATARNSGQLGTIFKSALSILAVQGILIVMLGWIAAGLLLGQRQPGAVDSVRIYLFSVPFTTLITYLSTMSQGLKQFQLFNAFRIAGGVGYIAVVSAAYMLDITAVSSIVASLLAVQVLMALAVLTVFYLRYHEVIADGNWQLAAVRQLLGYGARNYAGGLSWIANARLDQFVMSFYLGLVELGIYAVAVSYAGLFFPVFSAFAMVLFPSVAAVERSAAVPVIKRTLRLYAISSTIGCLLLAVPSSVLIPLLFGPEFNAAVLPARILLVGSIFLGANYVLSDALRGLGYPAITSVAEVVGLFVTIVSLLLLLPRLGIYGAAVTSLISYVSAFLFLYAAIRLLLGDLYKMDQKGTDRTEQVSL